MEEESVEEESMAEESMEEESMYVESMNVLEESIGGMEVLRVWRYWMEVLDGSIGSIDYGSRGIRTGSDLEGLDER